MKNWLAGICLWLAEFFNERYLSLRTPVYPSYYLTDLRMNLKHAKGTGRDIIQIKDNTK